MMIFTDDIVICSEIREQVKENTERSRSALKRGGMNVRLNKTESMCVNERKASGMVRLHGEEMKMSMSLSTLGQLFRATGRAVMR